MHLTYEKLHCKGERFIGIRDPLFHTDRQKNMYTGNSIQGFLCLGMQSLYIYWIIFLFIDGFKKSFTVIL